MVNKSLIFTFTAIDKPGLVETLSKTVSDLGGNWLESRMSQLSGYFTGIVCVQIISSQYNTLKESLLELHNPDLKITIQDKTINTSTENYIIQTINLLGNDRPGIVQELSNALVSLNINVCEMNTNISSAPMTAESLFEAIIDIQVPINLELNTLHDKLDEIANNLTLDITLSD